jgi:hypothetical protein
MLIVEDSGPGIHAVRCPACGTLEDATEEARQVKSPVSAALRTRRKSALLPARHRISAPFTRNGEGIRLAIEASDGTRCDRRNDVEPGQGTMAIVLPRHYPTRSRSPNRRDKRWRSPN